VSFSSSAVHHTARELISLDAQRNHRVDALARRDGTYAAASAIATTMAVAARKTGMSHGFRHSERLAP
jgi:hypothetical protein